ncbi:MAG TPA: hypothetical protein PLT68_12670 [Actinomycetota bacterium]|nr:hypothetical protein [Actinomycetota bacterium]
MTSDEDVRRRLSALPSPVMPDDVRAAIHARLAQEPPPRAGGSTQPVAEVVALTDTHRRRLGGLLVAAAVAGVAMLLPVAIAPSGPDPASPEPVVRAGAIYHPSGFGEQLRQRLRVAPARSATGTFADTEAGVRRCKGAIDAYGSVLSLDAGSYDRTEVVVMVTRYPASTSYEEIWVVGPQCGSTDQTVIRHILFDVDDSAATL